MWTDKTDVTRLLEKLLWIQSSQPSSRLHEFRNILFHVPEHIGWRWQRDEQQYLWCKASVVLSSLVPLYSTLDKNPMKLLAKVFDTFTSYDSGNFVLIMNQNTQIRALLVDYIASWLWMEQTKYGQDAEKIAGRRFRESLRIYTAMTAPLIRRRMRSGANLGSFDTLSAQTQNDIMRRI